jgi:hypothetical protein
MENKVENAGVTNGNGKINEHMPGYNTNGKFSAGFTKMKDGRCSCLPPRILVNGYCVIRS